ncbi:MAG: META domain-containing protein [Muribaculaceae bacterium]|nr:META domain-containing protein [Muribaculaceae bacterium]
MSATLIAAIAIGGASCSTTKQSNDEALPEAVLPQDREQIAAPKATRSYTPAELLKGIIKGDWAIESVSGKQAVGEEAPFLKFADDNRVYGNNGCNVINGVYKYNVADSTISFSKIATTMRMCGMTGITDGEINAALGEARFYSLQTGDNDRYLMTLFDSSHQPVMTLMHQNFQFLNSTWRVRQIEGVNVDNPDICLVIDVDEGHVHGNTGCNILNGSLTTDMDAANSLSFHSIGVTRKACPEPNFQTQLIVALEDASQARPVTADKAELLDSSGNIVMQLERIAVMPQ